MGTDAHSLLSFLTTTTSATSGAELQIDVDIMDQAGTWTCTAPGANAKRAGPCFGRAFPLEVRPARLVRQ